MQIVSISSLALTEQDELGRSIGYAWEEKVIIEAENIEEVNAFLGLHAIDGSVDNFEMLDSSRIRVTIYGIHPQRMYDKFFPA